MEYRHGGSCGAKQNVRFMSLKKVEESGAENRIFICSNLGRFGTVPTCSNGSKVSVSFQGTDKFDIKLSLEDLALTDSGHYYAEVDMEDFTAGRRMTIEKHFTVVVKGVLLAVVNAHYRGFHELAMPSSHGVSGIGYHHSISWGIQHG